MICLRCCCTEAFTRTDRPQNSLQKHHIRHRQQLNSSTSSSKEIQCNQNSKWQSKESALSSSTWHLGHQDCHRCKSSIPLNTPRSSNTCWCCPAQNFQECRRYCYYTSHSYTASKGIQGWVQRHKARIPSVCSPPESQREVQPRSSTCRRYLLWQRKLAFCSSAVKVLITDL